MRILALHGYTQNSHILAKRFGAIRKACGKNCEFVFVDGPHVLSQADVNFGNMDVIQTQPEPTDPEVIPRAWWVAKEDRSVYQGVQESLLVLREQLLQSRFDCVFGFSQGATMAAILAAVLEKPSLAAKYGMLADGKPVHPAFKLCVIAAGFMPYDLEFASMFTDKSSDDPAGLHTRSLHIVGTTDVVVTAERSQPLIDISTNPRVEHHPGGHFVPATAPWREFFRAYLGAQSDEEADGVPSPSLAAGGSGTSTPNSAL